MTRLRRKKSRAQPIIMMYLYKINEPKFLQQSQEMKQVIALPFLFFLFSQCSRLMQVNMGGISVLCIQVSLGAANQVVGNDHSPKIFLFYLDKWSEKIIAN